MPDDTSNSCCTFQSTLPARGATRQNARKLQKNLHFNPRSPHGERQGVVNGRAKEKHFNPRSPHGERRRLSHYHSNTKTFQSTLPARGATSFRFLFHRHRTISIHAPRTGSDDAVCDWCGCVFQFQSTLPARGATSLPATRTSSVSYFNPRSPHGERRVCIRRCTA